MSRFRLYFSDGVTQAISRYIYRAILDDRIAQIDSRHQMLGWIKLYNASRIYGKEPSPSFSEFTDGVLAAEIKRYYASADHITNFGEADEPGTDFAEDA